MKYSDQFEKKNIPSDQIYDGDPLSSQIMGWQAEHNDA